MFEFKYTVTKKENMTTFGSVCIKNIVFEPFEIEQKLPDIIMEDDNLMHMFAEYDMSDFNRSVIYKRFIPKLDMGSDIEYFVKQSIKNNKTFYSFLAEGILGLVFRDLYGYDLAKAVIDIQDTVRDSHTGVDACMYNLNNKVIVLGEAKFYENINLGMNQIINDLIEKNISNKMESLQVASENCKESYNIVLKNLNCDYYDEIDIKDFLEQKIIFAGFVLHSENDIRDYGKKDFYDAYFVDVNKLKDNISNSLKVKNITGEYEIVLVHLPINDKKNLIVKIINKAKEKLAQLRKRSL